MQTKREGSWCSQLKTCCTVRERYVFVLVLCVLVNGDIVMMVTYVICMLIDIVLVVMMHWS